MNDRYVFIETVKSKGTLRTIKHVISERKFEDEDLIVVKVLRADTQYQQDIAHLVVEDEHPDARSKKGHHLNVFILGDFPHKDIPFHAGEVIALGRGCISENDKGILELVFTNDKENTILREDFGRWNKDDVFSKTAKFSVPERLSNESLKKIKEIKKWIGCGLVAAVPQELTLKRATCSSKTVSRFNLACKVLEVREVVPCLGIITVADGSACNGPFLTINNDKELQFVELGESYLSVDIIVTLNTEALKNLKKGSYVRLCDIQGKRFSLPLSQHNDFIIFKIDGRHFNFESLVGSARAHISNLLNKRHQQNITAAIVHNNADDTTEQLSMHSSSSESCTILESDPRQTANPSNDEADDDSQSILRHRVPPSKLRTSDSESKFPGKSQQSCRVRDKQDPCCGEKKGVQSREERTHTEPDDGDQCNGHRGEASTSFRAAPSQRHKPVGGTCRATPGDVNKRVNKEPVRGHCGGNCSSADRARCGPSALNQSRAENNCGNTEQHSITDETSDDDEPLVIETLTSLRRLKYLPAIYHVNVWIKDVSPSLLGSPLDLITARCYICRKEQSYTRISKQQPHSEQQICEPCSSQGMPKFLELKFKFTLVLWDACGREISASVTGEEAEKFLKCSVYMFIRDKQIRQQVWNTLQKLKDRGCMRNYRRAQDHIEVDIGVTVERGLKKYTLLGGVLNNL